MEFFKHNTNIDFLGLRKWAAIFSLLLCTASIVAFWTNGITLGLDFTGGTQLQVKFQDPPNLQTIRKALEKSDFKDVQVQSYGTPEEVLINIAPHAQKHLAETEESTAAQQTELKNKVMAQLPNATLQQVQFIGPKVGQELATQGLLAVVVAMIGTMIYILMRFEYRFAVSSAVALIHDPILILGIFAYFHLEFDLNALAALLAVIGYSLNDTIVVFDRVRENFRKMRRGSPVDVVNKSINETLSRTIMTSGLTLIVVVVLYFYAGEQLKGFSLALIIGIVIGTYSSIYVAGSLAVAMGLNKKDLMPAPKEALDDRP